MVAYNNRISSLVANPATGGIADETDKVHTGLIKALEARSQGNYVISFGTLVQSSSGGVTRLTINSNSTNLIYKKDGVLISYGTQDEYADLTAPDGTNDRYDWLVITNATADLAVRAGTPDTSPTVPDLNLGDVPIALIKVVGGSSATATDRHFQIFGTNKSEDVLTVGYSNSGTYTKTGSFVGASGANTFTAESGTDIKMKLAGTAAGDTFEVIDSASQVQFKVQGDGAVSVPAGTFTAGATTIQNSDSTTNAVVFPFKISEETSGTPAAGLGVGMQYEVETAAGNNEIGVVTDARIVSTSSGNETFSYNISCMTGGTLTTYLTITNGQYQYIRDSSIAHPYQNLPDDSLQSDADANNASLQFGRFQLPDVQASTDNFINLPPLSSASQGQIITVKNITSNDLIIKGTGSDTIDYGSTANAMIGSANTVTLGSAMAITFQSIKAIDTSAYSNAILAPGGPINSWVVVSQTA